MRAAPGPFARPAREVQPPGPRWGNPLRSERNAAWLGISLGVAFGICFLTGLLSHLIQHPPGWFSWPARPAGTYRVTQGLHVATGIAAIPLLLVKLWTVYPKLWRFPPFDDAVDALERLSLFPLVSGAIFLLVSGTQNIFHWYPWRFFFPVDHWWA
ncbi:MAG TPA: molybdopterin-binding protein, partial [Acidimicrobiia bacterium]|nr:molybdopterin-binding protein [Acidimicrobiia bacterium]